MTNKKAGLAINDLKIKYILTSTYAARKHFLVLGSY